MEGDKSGEHMKWDDVKPSLKNDKKKNVDMFGTWKFTPAVWWKFTPAVWDLDNTNSSHSERLSLLTVFFPEQNSFIKDHIL